MDISIITPCFNSVKHIKETIDNVLNQKGHFEIEYIIIDGGSTDGTVESVRAAVERWNGGMVESNDFSPTHLHTYTITPNLSFKFLSERDNGMYDAINKGFNLATGDVFAWINSDDIYYPEAFQRVVEVFNKYKDVKWLTGNSNTINENSEITKKADCRFYSREWLKKGFYGYVAPFVEQEAVFFRKELWQRVGKLDIKYKLAGDYWLWRQFARFEELYSFDVLTSAFRQRKGQLSGDVEKYKDEMEDIKENSFFIEFFVRIFFKFEGHFPLKIANFLFRAFNKKSKVVNNDLSRCEIYNYRRDL